MRNDKDKLFELVNLMNEQSETPTMVTDDLLYVIDPALEPEEVDFLLKMGGGNLARQQIHAKVDLPEATIDDLLERLLDKGHVVEFESDSTGGERVLHLMSLLPGWFELYLMRGAETPDRVEFSKRLSGYFSAAREIPSEVLNAVMQDTAPHRSMAVANPPEARSISIGDAVEPPVSVVYPAHSVLGVFEQLDDDEIITVGHCFCRQQRKMDDDPCRLDLGDESCIALGPAAEHLIKRGSARRISKAEALDLIEEVERKGAVHQVGRIVPLKDFKPKYEVDIVCNCCWDCCGVFGNYSRGNIPFVLKSYYLAEMSDVDACNGCGICEDYCPVRAIIVNEDGTAEIAAEMCCGCGLCVLHCPEESVHLRPSERDVFLPVLDESQRRIA